MGNHKIANEHKKVHGESEGNHYGHQASSACCGWLVNGNCLPPPPTVFKQEELWDNAVPAVHVNLSKSARTAFVSLPNAMKAKSSISDTYFQQLTEWHGMETTDIWLGIIELPQTDSPYSACCKAIKVSHKHFLLTREDMRSLVVLYSEVVALQARGHMSCAWVQFSGW